MSLYMPVCPPKTVVQSPFYGIMVSVYGWESDAYGAKEGTEEGTKGLCRVWPRRAPGLEARGAQDRVQPLLDGDYGLSGRGVFGHGIHRLAGKPAFYPAEMGRDFEFPRVLRAAGRGGEQPGRVCDSRQQDCGRFPSKHCEQHHHVAGRIERVLAVFRHCGEQLGFDDVLGAGHPHVRRDPAPPVYGDARLRGSAAVSRALSAQRAAGGARRWRCCAWPSSGGFGG